MTVQTNHSNRLSALALGVALVIGSAGAMASDWQPLPSERLIKLPTQVMAKAIDKDFRASPLAGELQGARDEVEGIQAELASLKGAIGNAEGDRKIDLKHQFLVGKSAYLDAMEGQQALREQAIRQRIAVYGDVLDELQRDARRANDPVSREVREAQLAARERMERVTTEIDDMLYPAGGEGESEYNRDYANNIDKIKALQQAIASHDANQAATLNGLEVSREDFVRSLLADAEAELSLIRQENEMLGYMARLVALDAQALQLQVAYGDDSVAEASADPGKPANMVDYFIN